MSRCVATADALLRGSRPVNWLVVVCVVSVFASATRVAAAAPSGERRAQQANERARIALAEGDRRGAAFQLLRAAAWRPDRHGDVREDRLRGVRMLASSSPAAAVRHAVLALEAYNAFAACDPALLVRLANAAAEAGDPSAAARFAERHAAVLRSQPATSPRRMARVEYELGKRFVLADRPQSGSDAFHRARRLDRAAAASADVARSAYVVAVCHLEAERPDRAAVAIRDLAAAGGSATLVETLRARLALLEGRTLQAVEHARAAINAALAAADPLAAPPYSLLVEALGAANLADGAADELRALSRSAGASADREMAVVDALRRAGRADEAWRQSEALIDRLVTAAPAADPLVGSPRGGSVGEERAELLDAAKQHLGFAAAEGRVEAFTETLPRVVARLGGAGGLAPLIEASLADPRLRGHARTWAATVAGKPIGWQASAGTRRTATRLAITAGAPAIAVRVAGARLGAALRPGGPIDAAIAEASDLVEELRAAGAGASAVEFARWALSQADAAEGDATAEDTPADRLAFAILRTQLAELLTEQFTTPEAERDPDREVRRLLARALADAPGDAELAARRGAVWSRLGRIEPLHEACRVIGREDNAPWARDTRLTLADAELATGDADAAERVWLAVLDAWPNDRRALAGLALSWTARGLYPRRSARHGQRLLADDPDDPIGWRVVGRAAAAERDFASAVRAFRRAVELAAGDSPATSFGEEALDALRGELREALEALGLAEEAQAAAAPAGSASGSTGSADRP